jgi:hypothetical protein
MDIIDFIKILKYAAPLDGAQGSDIALQIIFCLDGEPLIKQAQEMAEDEKHNWEKLKEKIVQRWGKMLPLLKHTRNDLDNLISSTMVSGVKNKNKFQDFSIKLDNLVACLVRCKHMASVEEIRHAVLNCWIHPIRISVTKELIRDNQMTLSVDGSQILDRRTMAILEGGTTFAEDFIKQYIQPPPQKFIRQNTTMEKLTENYPIWNQPKQQPSPFIPLSNSSYKPAQLSRPPSSFKFNYCYMIGHKVNECNLIDQDIIEGNVIKEGRDFNLPDGTPIRWERNRPMKTLVDQF